MKPPDVHGPSNQQLSFDPAHQKASNMNQGVGNASQAVPASAIPLTEDSLCTDLALLGVPEPTKMDGFTPASEDELKVFFIKCGATEVMATETTEKHLNPA